MEMKIVVTQTNKQTNFSGKWGWQKEKKLPQELHCLGHRLSLYTYICGFFPFKILIKSNYE